MPALCLCGARCGLAGAEPLHSFIFERVAPGTESFDASSLPEEKEAVQLLPVGASSPELGRYADVRAPSAARISQM
jgi:hypothetical protein